jgi:hypothetical protein
MGLIEAWLNTAVREGFRRRAPACGDCGGDRLVRGRCFAAKWS